MNKFYIGSCRYMYHLDCFYFPGRLHSTREICYFLDNFDNIEKIVNSNLHRTSNIMFGDICHELVMDDYNRYIGKKINKKEITDLILEISTKKVYYYGDIPVNFFYSQHYSMVRKRNLQLKILNDEEIKNDIEYIKNKVKLIFNENCKIHIIPHLNLKTQSLNNYIPDRNELVNILKKSCETLDVNFYDVGKYIEESMESEEDKILEKYMNDGCHYTYEYGHKKILDFLKEKIFT